MSTIKFWFYQKMAENMEFKDANPPKTVQKTPKLDLAFNNVKPKDWYFILD